MNRVIFFILLVFSFEVFANQTKCRNLVRLTNIQMAIEPGQIIPATDSTPEYCHVRGVINRAIRFEVTMPVDWNGRFMFSTVGGFAGVIGDVTSLLPSGFAMASTDTGHELMEGAQFLKQSEARLDYAYRGVHLATLAAKQIIHTYYEKDIDYSYLHGCSNGGRAALMEAIHFPEDYDGIIAGAPVYSFSEFIPFAINVARAIKEHPLDAEALDVLAENSSGACDLLDGVEDGVINDPRLCTNDKLNLDALECGRNQTEGCLSAGQINTAKTIYADLKDKDGNIVSPGVMPGAENAGDWSFWTFPNNAPGFDGRPIVENMFDFLGNVMRHHPEFDANAYDPANDGNVVARELAPYDADDPDLADFKANGGKLIIYQGWNDFPLRPQRAFTHLNAVGDATGGTASTDEFFRLFMVPGMTHCAGGPGAWMTDYVEPLVSWREAGEAPARIIGAQSGKAIPFDHLMTSESGQQTRSFTRPQCVYPKLAQYKGSGDNTDASNYICK